MGHIGYEASARSGNAVCAFNGTGCTLSGLKIHIPETALCDTMLLIPPTIDEVDNEEAQAAIKRQNEHEPEISASDEVSMHSNPSEAAKSAIPAGRDITLQNLPRAVMLPSIPLPAPSDVRDHNSPICSNPWTKDTRTADRMTLDIVLVVPTQRIDIASTLSQPSSSAVWATQSINTSSPMVTSEGSGIFPSTLTPTPATGTYSKAAVNGQSGGNPTRNGSSVHGTDLSNGVEYVNLRTVIVVGIFTLILWAFIFLHCL